MRKAFTISVIVTILAVVAYLTKPSEAQCRNKAKEAFIEKKLSGTMATLPSGIDRTVFSATLEKSFMQGLRVEDKFLYRSIYQATNTAKTSIGWGAFGWINVAIE